MKSLLKIDELLNAVGGKIIGDSKECYFTSVQTDSRNVVKNTLFVPLIGEYQNGHKYIPSALEKGASVVFVKKSEYEQFRQNYVLLSKDYPKTVFIVVEQTMKALQDAAECYVEKFPSLLKISVTGSCGKTTVKEMLVSVFKAKYGRKVVYTKGNFNSETGLPLSVFQIRKNHRIGIFEMGMNRVNEIGEISKVLKSNYGIITNIGTAHIGILGSQKNIAEEKRKSLAYINKNGAAFVPAADAFADFCTEQVKGKVVKFGKSVCDEYDVKFISDNGLMGTTFSVSNHVINLKLSGEHNFENCLGVIALAEECGLSPKIIKKGLEKLNGLSGRMESEQLKLNGKNVTVLKDFYNANLDSMEKVIEFAGSLKNTGKIIFVLADMKELGEKSKEAHTKIGNLIAQKKAGFVFFVGEEMKAAYEVIQNEHKDYLNNSAYRESIDSFEEIAGAINEMVEEKSVIVLKGSHSMQLEKLLPLIKKGGLR